MCRSDFLTDKCVCVCSPGQWMDLSAQPHSSSVVWVSDTELASFSLLFFYFFCTAAQRRDAHTVPRGYCPPSPPSLLDWNDNEETMQAEYS